MAGWRESGCEGGVGEIPVVAFGSVTGSLRGRDELRERAAESLVLRLAEQRAGGVEELGEPVE
jgi:hypothetical protein